MALGTARPPTALELVTAIDLVPTVGGPCISGARPHRVTSDPHMLVALPAPVSRRPRITVALHGNYFNPRRRRSDLDNDSACERRSGRNAARKNQRQQQASHSPVQRAIRVRSYTACSPRQRGAIRCSSHEVNTFGRWWKFHYCDDRSIARNGRYGGAHTQRPLIPTDLCTTVPGLFWRLASSPDA